MNITASEIIKLVFQLFILGILGGAVTWYYSRLQKNREIRISILKEFASLHGRFISLRFQANYFYVEWRDGREASTHALSDEERRIEKWKQYQSACSLIGEFVGLKPLIIKYFPETSKEVEFLHSKYQDWRRRIGGGQLILQQVDGKNEESYNKLKDAYNDAIGKMKVKI
jgi:hypothetical protein